MQKHNDKSTLRGYPITLDKKTKLWYFDDTGEPTVETYKNRPCGKCGKGFNKLIHV